MLEELQPQGLVIVGENLSENLFLLWGEVSGEIIVLGQGRVQQETHQLLVMLGDVSLLQVEILHCSDEEDVGFSFVVLE